MLFRLKENVMDKEQDYQRRIKELDIIWRINENIASFNSLDEFLEQMMQASADLMDATSGSIMLVDPHDREILVVRAYTGLRKEAAKGARRKIGEGIAGMVAKRREGMLLLDDLMDPALRTKRKVADALSVPIISGSELLGVLNLNTRKDRAFDEHDLFIVNTLIRQMAVGIDRGRTLEELRKKLDEADLVEKRMLRDQERLTQELEKEKDRYQKLREEHEKMRKLFREMTKPVV
jgi:signal transduction protein with GAF and PtsI domain